MTRTITIRPPAGVSAPWAEWAEHHGLQRALADLTGGSLAYYDRDGDVRMEISGERHRDEPWVTFSTNHLGTGDAAVASLALIAWETFGGTMSASLELRSLIRGQAELGEMGA